MYMNNGYSYRREPEIYAAFSVSSEAVTENARISNGGEDQELYARRMILPREPEIYAAFFRFKRSGHGKRANIERRQGRENIRCKYKNKARTDHQRKGISRRVFRFSGAVTENARDRPGLGGHWVVVVSWFMGGNLLGCFRGCILWAGLLGGFRCAEGFSVEGRTAGGKGRPSDAGHRTAGGRESPYYVILKGWILGCLLGVEGLSM